MYSCLNNIKLNLNKIKYTFNINSKWGNFFAKNIDHEGTFYF